MSKQASIDAALSMWMGDPSGGGEPAPASGTTTPESEPCEPKGTGDAKKGGGLMRRLARAKNTVKGRRTTRKTTRKGSTGSAAGPMSRDTGSSYSEGGDGSEDTAVGLSSTISEDEASTLGGEQEALSLILDSIHNGESHKLKAKKGGVSSVVSVSAICDALQRTPRVTRINLSYNNIGDLGVMALATMLETNKHITEADLRHTGVTDIGLAKLLTVLQHTNFTLSSLQLAEERRRSKEALTSGLPTKRMKALQRVVKQNSQLYDCVRGKSSRLSFSQRELPSCPDIVFSLMNLSELSIDHNALVEFPKDVIVLQHLRTLNLSHNQISVIGTFVATLPSLTHLDMSHNVITEVPPEFGKASVLKYLNVSHNRVATLPIELSNIHALQHLLVDHNPVCDMLCAVGHIHELTEDPQYSSGHSAQRIGALLALLKLPREARRTRLVFLGNACTGKTSVVRMLASEGSVRTYECATAAQQSYARWQRRLQRLDAAAAVDTAASISSSNSGKDLAAIFEDAESPTSTLGASGCDEDALRSERERAKSALDLLEGSGGFGDIAPLPDVAEGGGVCDSDGSSSSLFDSLPGTTGGAGGSGETSSALTGHGNGLIIRAGVKSLMHSGLQGRKSSSDGPGGSSSSGGDSGSGGSGGDGSGGGASGSGGVSDRWAHMKQITWTWSPPGLLSNPITYFLFDLVDDGLFPPTHPFFLVPEALYVVTFNMTLPVAEARLDFWLQSITMNAPDATIIVVGTHTGGMSPVREEAVFREVYQLYGPRFPTLMPPFHPVNVRTGAGVDILRSRLAEQASLEEHVQRVVPIEVWGLQAAVHQYVSRPDAPDNEPPIVPWITYAALAKRAVGLEGEALVSATSVLQSLGVLARFEGQGWEGPLAGSMLLHPVWLSYLFSSVALLRKRLSRPGRALRIDDVCQMWLQLGVYTLDTLPMAVALLSEFEVWHPLSDTDVLLPLLLSSQTPHSWSEGWPIFKGVNPNETLVGRIYKFNLLPVGFFARLVIRVFKFMRASKFYRRDMMVIHPPHGNVVHLRYDEFASELMVAVKGTESKPQESIHLIVEIIHGLIKDWYNVEVDVLLTCPHCMRSTNDRDAIHCWRFDHIVGAVGRGETTVMCPNGDAVLGIDQVAPDVAMSDLAAVRAPYADFKMDTILGEGAFAHVYQGMFHGETVAIKQLFGGQKKKKKRRATSVAVPVGDKVFLSVNMVQGEAGAQAPSVEAAAGQDDAEGVVAPATRALIEDWRQLTVMRRTNADDMSAAGAAFHSEGPDSLGEGTNHNASTSSCGGEGSGDDDGDDDDGDGMSLTQGNSTYSQIWTDFRREIYLMKAMRHPCLVQLRGINPERLCIAMEFVPHGNLYDYLHDVDAPMQWPLLLKVAVDIASGVCFLHHIRPYPIVHRDLKSPNVLLHMLTPTAPCVAKIADFGLSRWGNRKFRGRAVDNPVWLAPEIMEGGEYDAAVDVYALGVIMWELVSREDLFGGESFMFRVEERLLSGERPEIPEHVPQSLRDLITECWAGDPCLRPSAADCVARLRDIIAERGLANMIHVVDPMPPDQAGVAEGPAVPGPAQKLRSVTFGARGTKSTGANLVQQSTELLMRRKAGSTSTPSADSGPEAAPTPSGSRSHGSLALQAAAAAAVAAHRRMTSPRRSETMAEAPTRSRGGTSVLASYIAATDDIKLDEAAFEVGAADGQPGSGGPPSTVPPARPVPGRPANAPAGANRVPALRPQTSGSFVADLVHTLKARPTQPGKRPCLSCHRLMGTNERVCPSCGSEAAVVGAAAPRPAGAVGPALPGGVVSIRSRPPGSYLKNRSLPPPPTGVGRGVPPKLCPGCGVNLKRTARFCQACGLRFGASVMLSEGVVASVLGSMGRGRGGGGGGGRGAGGGGAGASAGRVRGRGSAPQRPLPSPRTSPSSRLSLGPHPRPPSKSPRPPMKAGMKSPVKKSPKASPIPSPRRLIQSLPPPPTGGQPKLPAGAGRSSPAKRAGMLPKAPGGRGRGRGRGVGGVVGAGRGVKNGVAKRPPTKGKAGGRGRGAPRTARSSESLPGAGGKGRAGCKGGKGGKGGSGGASPIRKGMGRKGAPPKGGTPPRKAGAKGGKKGRDRPLPIPSQ